MKAAILSGLGLLAVMFLIAVSTPYWFAAKREATVDVRDPQLIRKGEYLARAEAEGRALVDVPLLTGRKSAGRVELKA